MNARANIATIFLTMALVSLAGAMTTVLNTRGSIEYPFWLFALFFILLRIKMYFDDLEVFKAVTRLRWGIVVGIFSWFFWVLSAANIGSIQVAALMLFIAILIATFALLYTCKVSGFSRRFTTWLVFNVIYMVLLLVLCVNPGFCFPWQAGLIVLGIAIAVFDFYRSGSLDVIDKAS